MMASGTVVTCSSRHVQGIQPATSTAKFGRWLKSTSCLCGSGALVVHGLG